MKKRARIHNTQISEMSWGPSFPQLPNMLKLSEEQIVETE